ncbi:unnamed protein product [Protopolystoma xenopodis]|uniref:Uncharacterized protein n=1 Tax=Protopolystoma xenopodis TaxID=117903 RepID=A0A3S5FDI9_9PLAT|nr:unnamed protein product [Protopolystoma xenopodis]
MSIVRTVACSTESRGRCCIRALFKKLSSSRKPSELVCKDILRLITPEDDGGLLLTSCGLADVRRVKTTCEEEMGESGVQDEAKGAEWSHDARPGLERDEHCCHAVLGSAQPRNALSLLHRSSGAGCWRSRRHLECAGSCGCGRGCSRRFCHHDNRNQPD